MTDTRVTGAGCSVQNGSLLSESLAYTDSSEVIAQSMYRAGLPERSFMYSYDSRHQLVDAKEELVGDYRAAFSYSDAGRLLSVDPLAGVIAGRDSLVYSHGDGSLAGADFHAPVDLLGSEKELHYSYDASGNVVTRQEVTDPGGVADVAEWDFSYDGVSQQREVLLNNGAGGRELYYYDDAGQRYMTVTYAQKGEAVPERVRIWMGGAEIWFEQNSSGELEVATEYAYLSLGNVNIGRIKEDILGVTTEATFANGLSHIMGALNWDTGVVNAAYIYGPYGKLVDSTGPEQDDHLRRFNGEESDPLSKLSYYGYRYYDEQSLAWTQADPLYLFAPDISGDNPREMSLYTFSLNNPVRYMDPDGRAATNPGCTHCGGDGSQYGKNGIVVVEGDEADTLVLDMENLTGLKLEKDEKGVLSIVGFLPLTNVSGTAAELLTAMIEDKEVTARFIAKKDVEGSGGLFAGPNGEGESYTMMMDHFAIVRNKVDESLSKALLAHEIFKNYLFAHKGKYLSYKKRHQPALYMEETILKELGASFHRQSVSWGPIAPSPFFGHGTKLEVNFGTFTMHIERGFGGGYDDFWRVNN